MEKIIYSITFPAVFSFCEQRIGMGSNQDFANASRIELSKCECESNRVGHCECESNQKTANCESICELRPNMGHFLNSFLSSYKIFEGKKLGIFLILRRLFLF